MSDTKSPTTEPLVPFRRFMLLPPLLVMILAVVELQFAELSWHIIYDRILYRTVWDEIFSLTKHLDAANHFPEVLPIAVAVFVTWVYSPGKRSTIVPFLIAIGIASAAVGLGKEAFGRARPHISIRMDIDKRHQEMWQYMEAHPDAGLKMEAGDYWLGLQLDRPWFRGDFASFPSGHASSAFVFAFWLTLIYGRLRWLWYLLAVGTCLARIRFRRHYPGDVMMGGAVGWLITYLIFTHPASARLGVWGEKKTLQVWDWIQGKAGRK